MATNCDPAEVGENIISTATINTGTNVSYTRDFGDDFFAAGQIVAHTYALPGTYTATLTATNSAGSAITTTTVTIEKPTHFIYLPVAFKP